MPDKIAQAVCGADTDRVMPSFPMAPSCETDFRMRSDIEWCDLATLQCSTAFRALPPPNNDEEMEDPT
jgi:hypothetical protein